MSRRRTTFIHTFVDSAPDVLEEGVLYVSLKYDLAIHLCACGCQTEIATPIAPNEWHFTYDGETITLDPSIGNQLLPCRTHYWYQHNQIAWLADFGGVDLEVDSQDIVEVAVAQPASRWRAIWRWLRRHG